MKRVYELIAYFKDFAKVPFIIENVKPYYTPPFAPTIVLGRHYFWANFSLSQFLGDLALPNHEGRIPSAFKELDLKQTAIKNRRQAVRNLVDYNIGKSLFIDFLKTKVA